MNEPEETQEENEARMDAEIAAVIAIMKQEWPACVDYTQRDDDFVEILDANDNVITTITPDRLTDFWNLSEGHMIIQYLGGPSITVFRL